MNPFKDLIDSFRLDYLLARYSSDEATAEEYAELQTYIDDSPELAAYVEQQRADFIAAFPNYQMQKAAGWLHLQQFMPRREPATGPGLVARTLNAVGGAIQELVEFCSAGELAIYASANPGKFWKSQTRLVDGITVTVDATQDGLNISAQSDEPQKPGTIITLYHQPPVCDATAATAADDLTLEVGRPVEGLSASGELIRAFELCVVELKPGRRNPHRFIGSARVSAEKHVRLKNGTYFLAKKLPA